MPILTAVNKKAPAAKMLILYFYIILTLGGITMIYPFLIMISGSMKGAYNSKNLNLFPRYFTDDVELYRAYCESKYQIDTVAFNSANNVGIVSFDTLEPGTMQPELASEYKEFIKQSPPPQLQRLLGHVSGRRSTVKHKKGFVDYLGEKFNNDLSHLINNCNYAIMMKIGYKARQKERYNGKSHQHSNPQIVDSNQVARG